MEKYQVINNITLCYGTLMELTEKQAKIRSLSLRSVKNNLYKAIDTVCFKAGEVIGLDKNTISKTVLVNLKPLKETKTPAKGDTDKEKKEDKNV